MMERGYVCEVFSSYQGEGGSVRGSCYGKRQVFVRFAGCNLASGEMGTEGCVFCDSPHAKLLKMPEVRLELRPGSKKFAQAPNPADPRLIAGVVEKLSTRDVHSVSITGGEPLWQPSFLRCLACELRDRGRKLYLETNGSLPSKLSGVAELFDSACVDIKDRSSQAARPWSKLVDREIESIRLLKACGAATFAKVVVTASSRPHTIDLISSRLAALDCPLAIQPVTPVGPVVRPSPDLLFRLTQAAAKHLQPDDITLSLQTHRFIDLP